MGVMEQDGGTKEGGYQNIQEESNRREGKCGTLPDGRTADVGRASRSPSGSRD
jgi:hypothetical protein